MKLTEAKLKKLIVEVINEGKAMPKPPAGFPMDKIEKINNLINSDMEGDVDQAHSIMSALGAESYVPDYILATTSGAIEKLAANANEIGPGEPGSLVGQDRKARIAIDNNAYNIAQKIAMAELGLVGKIKKEALPRANELFDDYKRSVGMGFPSLRRDG